MREDATLYRPRGSPAYETRVGSIDAIYRMHFVLSLACLGMVVRIKNSLQFENQMMLPLVGTSWMRWSKQSCLGVLAARPW